MTIGQFLETLNSNMLICSIIDDTGRIVVEKSARNILHSDKDLINIEILSWDINEDGSLMINIE